MQTNWHNLNDKEIFSYLNSNSDGLNTREVEKRQKQYGKNVLPKEKEPTILQILVSQFKSPMIIILVIATILSVIIREYLDGIFIGVAILINAILGTYQEYSAIKSASSIQKLLKIKVAALRNGQRSEIDSEELVPGDIVFLNSGDKVPADLRLLETFNLHLDEAFLTGESIGVIKNTKIVNPEASTPERANMCYASSTVQSGRGVGIVVSTGINTEIGNIAKKLVETKETKSPLVIRMERFTKQIMYVVIVFAIIASFLMVIKDYPSNEIFLLVVAMCVSAIPESLPIAQTIVLSIATTKLAKKNIIIKKLSCVESLGSCTVIASDKTGTLTLNQQTAKIIALPNKMHIEVTGEGYNDKGKLIIDNDDEVLNSGISQICHMGVLNNEAFLEKKDDKFVYHGDSIDLAFLALGLKCGISESKLKKSVNILGRIPYESEAKFSAIFFEEENENYVSVKGSAETILEFCSNQLIGNHQEPLDMKKAEQEVLSLSKDGYRVIAIAIGKYHGENKPIFEKQDIRDLSFLGFVGFIDPIRSTSKNAIKKCHRAGIRVMMITGDHPLTAKSIAKDLALIDDEERVVTGFEIEKAYHNSKKELIKLVTEHNIFARVSPTQKSIIVETLKKQREFVAVTGDGINDAPALKKANIGVAMGSGTDVAKEVSAMIITNDNFLSIVTAVEEGRYAYNNVRKIVYLLISTAFAEMLLFISSVLFNLPMPFTTVQILWINLVTNGIQDIATAFEKGEKGVMEEMPRATNEKIFNPLLIKETLLSGSTMFLIVLLVWIFLNNRNIMPIEQARNFILLLMVLLQNIHVFNCRSEKTSIFKLPLKNNKFIVYAVLSALSLHIIFMNVPLLQSVLNTNPVSLIEFGTLLLLILPLLLVMEIFKWLNRKKLFDDAF